MGEEGLEPSQVVIYSHSRLPRPFTHIVAEPWNRTKLFRVMSPALNALAQVARIVGCALLELPQDCPGGRVCTSTSSRSGSDRTRTCNRLVRTEVPVHWASEPLVLRKGLEPPTRRL